MQFSEKKVVMSCNFLLNRTQGWLHKLKDALEELPPSTVSKDTLGLKGIRLADHVPGKPVTLEFQPPEVR